MTDLKYIAPLVERQFPAFYREEGENFIQFVKAYYEWLDEQGPTYKARRIDDTFDIDDTADEYVQYFMSKFVKGIPFDIRADQRLLEKHILNVYRAKGSIEGLKLLFRLIYGREINVYIPEVDMLRVSDGKWERRNYLEVTNKNLNYTFNNKFIRGSTTGALAYVSSAVKLYLGNQIADVFYVTNITANNSTGATFIPGEYVLYDGLDIHDAPYILGSPTSAIIDGSTEDHSTGDILETSSTSGEGLKFVVGHLSKPHLNSGFLTFKIKNGGYGYALDSNVSISYGTATQGTGANFKVKSLKNTKLFQYNNNFLSNFDLNTLISATDYGANLNLANSSTVINSGLSYATMTVGTISKLGSITSGDKQYNGTVLPRVFDRRVAGYSIQDSTGGYWGDDAVITGTPSNGNGVIETVQLVSSGFGFNSNTELLNFVNQTDDGLNADLYLNIGGVGTEEGHWINTDGMLNEDKYIQDSYYYQEYSYEIQFEKSLDKYIDILKQTMHPVGNKVFGKTVIKDINSTKNLEILTETASALEMVSTKILDFDSLLSDEYVAGNATYIITPEQINTVDLRSPIGVVGLDKTAKMAPIRNGTFKIGVLGKSNLPANVGRTFTTYTTRDLSTFYSLFYYVNKGGLSWGDVPDTNEDLYLQYSIDGITWNTIDATTPSSVTSNVWTKKAIIIPTVAQTQPVYLRYTMNQLTASGAFADHWAVSSLEAI